jgi:hypothetical protein
MLGYTNLPADPELLALLERAKSLPPPTPDELAAQRRSWVIGEMMMGDDNGEGALSREDAEALYDKMLGAPCAHCGR